LKEDKPQEALKTFQKVVAMESEKGDWCVADTAASFAPSHDADTPRRAVVLHLVSAGASRR